MPTSDYTDVVVEVCRSFQYPVQRCQGLCCPFYNPHTCPTVHNYTALPLDPPQITISVGRLNQTKPPMSWQRFEPKSLSTEGIIDACFHMYSHCYLDNWISLAIHSMLRRGFKPTTLSPEQICALLSMHNHGSLDKSKHLIQRLAWLAVFLTSV